MATSTVGRLEPSGPERQNPEDLRSGWKIEDFYFGGSCYPDGVMYRSRGDVLQRRVENGVIFHAGPNGRGVFNAEVDLRIYDWHKDLEDNTLLISDGSFSGDNGGFDSPPMVKLVGNRRDDSISVLSGQVSIDGATERALEEVVLSVRPSEELIAEGWKTGWYAADLSEEILVWIDQHNMVRLILEPGLTRDHPVSPGAYFMGWYAITTAEGRKRYEQDKADAMGPKV